MSYFIKKICTLYEPDKTKDWETNNLILKQANPVALEVPEIWEDLLKKRAYAIAVENSRENFVTKHCNIIYRGVGTETYIDTKDVQERKVANIVWEGRVVYVALDLSESNDNTSVTIVVADDDNNILAWPKVSRLCHKVELLKSLLVRKLITLNWQKQKML